VLRRVFGPKRDEVSGEWRKLHNEELLDLYFSPRIRIIKARRMRRVRHTARMGGEEERVSVVGGKAEGRWLDNIGMDLVEVGWGDVDWIGAGGEFL
jgi:hypothetical protein